MASYEITEYFFETARMGKLHTIEPELLTEENLITKHNNGEIPLHWSCALEKELEHIPQKILSNKNLTIPNMDGSTPLHWAAFAGNLNKLPQEILSQENLTIADNQGYTVFHTAAAKGHLSQIPQKLLTIENLNLKSKDNTTVFREAINFACNKNNFNGLNGIPYPTLKHHTDNSEKIHFRYKHEIKEIAEITQTLKKAKKIYQNQITQKLNTKNPPSH
jgi:hypothetical protein